MSEETPKITTILKEKDPKRVEAGKCLAALNKERKPHKEQKEDINENKININYSLILNVIGVTAAVVSLYYVRKEFNRQLSCSAAREAVKEEKPQMEPSPTKEQLSCKPQKVLDTLE